VWGLTTGLVGEDAAGCGGPQLGPALGRLMGLDLYLQQAFSALDTNADGQAGGRRGMTIDRSG
jgi:hypothetical protein